MFFTIFESESYVQSAEKYNFTESERLEILYRVAAKPLQGEPLSRDYPEILTLGLVQNPRLQVLYVVSADLDSIHLLLVHLKSEPINYDSRIVKIIKRLATLGVLMELKDLLREHFKEYFEHIKKSIKEYFFD